MKIHSYDFNTQIANWHFTIHNTCDIARVYYIKQGNILYSDLDSEFYFKKNTLYILPTTSTYTIASDDSISTHACWFHVDLFPEVISNLQTHSVKEGTVIWYLLEGLMAHILTHPKEDTITQGFLMSIESYFTDTITLEKISKTIETTLLYISQHLSDSDLSVESLSSYLGYTSEHFIRIFYKEIGITPYQYIFRQRMAHAKMQLVSNISVSNTAHQVGYEDPKIFSRAFRKCFGISPTEYSLNKRRTE
ncbi:MAG: AraC family transcriptional regulator [Lachnospiraceae bacterium]